MVHDHVLQALLADDMEAQRSRDAGRVYEIERKLVASPSMPPVARMTLQRERASLLGS